MKKRSSNSDIDFIEVVKITWKKKLLIFSIILSAVILMLGFVTLRSETPIKYTLTTEILPISKIDEMNFDAYNKYIDQINPISQIVRIESLLVEQKKSDENIELINSNLTFPKIDKYFLLTLFLDKLKEDEGAIFIDPIKKFNLIKKEDFTNDEEYQSEVLRLASSVLLLEDFDKNIPKEINIHFENKNIENWLSVLKFVEESLNEAIRLYLYQLFERKILDANKLKQYTIEDIDLKISHALENYEKETLSIIAFLQEQSKIARELNIRNNNIYTENNTLGSISENNKDFELKVKNITKQYNYYLRGYNVIEKEIELLQNRADKKLFIPEILRLERKKNEFLSNKDVERLKILIDSTPLSNKNKFKAANINYVKTNYERIGNASQPISRMLLFAVLFGASIGIFYVIIQNILRTNR